LTLNAPVLALPDVAFVPAHDPDAVQLVAPVLDQVSCEAAPDWTLVGEAAKVSVGTGNTVTMADCDAEPPAPVHVSV
jgi:hypothetical protein